MSALTATGSTARWRRIRVAVFARDGRVCQVPLADGEICGDYAATVGHIRARLDGGADTFANLRAECARHNYTAGAQLRTRRPTLPDHRARRW